MIFNGIEKNYISVMRGRIRPFFAPLNRNSKFDSRLIKTDRGHRVIEVPVLIEYENITEFRGLTEEISGWLVHEEPKVLEFEDEPDRFYWAVIDDTITEEELYNQGTEATLKFICGYKYSHERTVDINSTASELIEGHTSTDWKSRTTFTSAQSSYTLEANSPGKTDLRDKNIIKLSYNFIAGDVLVINYRKREATLNGEDITNAVSILQSNFMQLPKGYVDFSASHKTEISYFERYY